MKYWLKPKHAFLFCFFFLCLPFFLLFFLTLSLKSTPTHHHVTACWPLLLNMLAFLGPNSKSVAFSSQALLPSSISLHLETARLKVCLLWFFSQILMKLSLHFLTNLFLESHIKDTKHPKGNHDISGSIRSLPCLSDGNGTPLLPHMGKVFVPWVTAWKTPQGKRWKQAGIVAFSLWGWHYAWRMSSKEEQKSGDRPPT